MSGNFWGFGVGYRQSYHMMFLRIATLAPVVVTLLCLANLLRRRGPYDRPSPA